MVSSRSPIKRYVFDLDGTLFDTEHRVRQAYLDAGVDMPDDAWGKPAVAWLPALKGSHWKQYHQRKTELYLRSLRAIPPRRTSAASAMIELALSGVETYVITGASREATRLLLAGFQPYHYRLLGTAADRETKLTAIKKLNGRRNELVYVDDDDEMCDVMEAHGYCVVRYSITLAKEEVLEQWARSSLPPEEASA